LPEPNSAAWAVDVGTRNAANPTARADTTETRVLRIVTLHELGKEQVPVPYVGEGNPSTSRDELLTQ